MAQWEELNKLCQANSSIHEKFVEICRRLRFPYKIRCRFAAWIEQQDWSIDVNADDGRHIAESLQHELLSKIQLTEEAMRNEIPYELEKVLDIQLAKKEIESLDVKSFTNALKLCLHEEKMLIQSCSNETKETKCKSNDASNAANQSERLQELRRKVQEMLREIINAETCVGRISQDQNQLVDSIGKETANIDKRICAAPPAKKAELNNQKQKMLAEHEKVLRELFARRSAMVDSLIHLAIQLAYLLQMVWSEIRKWQNEQKYISVGLVAQPPRDNLDAIDVICEEVSNILNRVILQVEKAITMFQRYPNRAASNPSDDETSKLILVNTELIKDYLPRHLHCLFIVEQNLEGGILCLDGGKSGQFKITLRFLGGKAFGLGFSRPVVKMFLKSARELNAPAVSTDGAGNGVGGDCSFTVDMPTGRCRAEFQGVHIENLRPSVTGSSATGGCRFDKHAFLFQTVVHVCGRDIPLQTISNPVIVTNDQMGSVVARGVLVWDAAFSEPGRRPFVYKDMVHWPEFAQMLNSLFVNATGRELSAHHIDYLARLLYNGSHDFSARHVRERHVIYDNMGGRKFSFWAWFWANLALCRDIVNSEWRAGLIYGFISKEDARNKLQDMPRGTFLLRFSESDIDNPEKHANDAWSERKCNVYGYLTIAVIEADPQNSVAKKLFYIKDYLSPKDLMEKGLSEILQAMEVADRLHPNVKVPLLNHLWPDTSKTVDQCFDIYRRQNGSSDSTEDEDGYKKSKFAIQIFLSDRDVGGGRGLRGSSIQRHDSNSSMSTVMSLDSMCSDEGTTIVPQCDSSSPSPQYAVRVDTAKRIATVNPQPSSVPRVRAAVRQMLPATPGMHHAGINTAMAAAAVFDDESMDSVSSDMSSVSSAGGLQMGMVNTVALFNLNSGGGQS